MTHPAMPDFELLARYHAHPGRTVAMLNGWRDGRGLSSYEVLATRFHALPRDYRVLDLACGDGSLLELLWRAGFRRLEGLDQSAEELAAARGRLGPAIALHRADARATGLPSRSFDVVVSHMALMLVSPVERVLAEVARLCEPGGRVFAVLNRPVRDMVFEAFRSRLHRATLDAGLERLRLGDSRTMSREGLLELFGVPSFDPDRLHVEDFEVRTEAPPRALWSQLELMYDVFRLPDDAREQLGRRVRARWRSLAGTDAPLACTVGMRLVEARTAAPLKTATGDTGARAR
jgi:SAM-dependent methyltransferase